MSELKVGNTYFVPLNGKVFDLNNKVFTIGKATITKIRNKDLLSGKSIPPVIYMDAENYSSINFNGRPDEIKFSGEEVKYICSTLEECQKVTTELKVEHEKAYLSYKERMKIDKLICEKGLEKITYLNNIKTLCKVISLPSSIVDNWEENTQLYNQKTELQENIWKIISKLTSNDVKKILLNLRLNLFNKISLNSFKNKVDEYDIELAIKFIDGNGSRYSGCYNWINDIVKIIYPNLPFLFRTNDEDGIVCTTDSSVDPLSKAYKKTLLSVSVDNTIETAEDLYNFVVLYGNKVKKFLKAEISKL